VRHPERTPLARVTVERGAVFVDGMSKRGRVLVAVWETDEEVEEHAARVRAVLASDRASAS
jgi:hypothetical protein